MSLSPSIIINNENEIEQYIDKNIVPKVQEAIETIKSYTGNLASSNTGFDGDEITLTVYDPSISPANIIGYGTSTVSSGATAFPSLAALKTGNSGIPVVDGSISFTNDTMTFLYSEKGTTFGSGAFNGYELQTANNDPAITAASIISTNIPGLSASDLSFTAHSIDLNVAGLTLPSDVPGSIVLGFQFAGQSNDAPTIIANPG